QDSGFIAGPTVAYRLLSFLEAEAFLGLTSYVDRPSNRLYGLETRFYPLPAWIGDFLHVGFRTGLLHRVHADSTTSMYGRALGLEVPVRSPEGPGGPWGVSVGLRAGTLFSRERDTGRLGRYF